MRAGRIQRFKTIRLSIAGRGAGYRPASRRHLMPFSAMMDANDERPFVPSGIMHGASGRQILGIAAMAKPVSECTLRSLSHCDDSDAWSLSAAVWYETRAGNQRVDMPHSAPGARPTQKFALKAAVVSKPDSSVHKGRNIARGSVGSPHGAPQEQIHHPRESQLIQLFKRVPAG